MSADEATEQQSEDQPVAARDMSADQYQDFINELRAYAFEEASLWEVPLGCTDLLSSGNVEHGPWLPEDCSRVLLTFFDAGLIALYRLGREAGQTDQDLEPTVARQWLAEPHRWTRPDMTNSEIVNMYATPLGGTTELERWRALVPQAEAT